MEQERLLKQIIHLTRNIQGLADKTAELHFPSNIPSKYIQLTTSIASAIQDEALLQYSSDPKPDQDFTLNLKFMVNKLRLLAAFIRFAERATTRHTPWSLIRPLERLAEKLHPESCFLFRPQWSYNYTISEPIPAFRTNLVQFLSPERLENALDMGGSLKRLYIIGFPYVERLSVLLHVMFGHELGHPLISDFIDNEDKPPDNAKLVKDVEEALTVQGIKSESQLARMERKRRLLKEIVETRRYALSELLCDLVCLTLFGPAAIFALEEYCLSAELNRLERNYPPWRYRLRFMAENLPDAWVDEFLAAGAFQQDVQTSVRNKIRSIRALASDRSDRDNLNKSPETRIAYELVEQALPDLVNYVTTRLADRGFRLSDLICDTNSELLARLQNWIPPDSTCSHDSQIEVGADIRVILNIGWISWVSTYDYVRADPRDTAIVDSAPDYAHDVPSTDKAHIETHFAKTDALNRLVLKAVEYADLRRIWDEHEKEPLPNGSVDEERDQKANL